MNISSLVKWHVTLWSIIRAGVGVSWAVEGPSDCFSDPKQLSYRLIKMLSLTGPPWLRLPTPGLEGKRTVGFQNWQVGQKGMKWPDVKRWLTLAWVKGLCWTIFKMTTGAPGPQWWVPLLSGRHKWLTFFFSLSCSDASQYWELMHPERGL